jgi:hypothetical protein
MLTGSGTMKDFRILAGLIYHPFALSCAQRSADIGVIRSDNTCRMQRPFDPLSMRAGHSSHSYPNLLMRQATLNKVQPKRIAVRYHGFHDSLVELTIVVI